MRLAFPLTILASTLSASAFIACSSSTPSGGPDPTTLAQATSLYAYALCNRTSACSPLGLRSLFGDLSTCIASYTSNTTLLAQAPGNGVTVAALEACADAYNGATCASFEQDKVVGCDLAGTLADGAPCGLSAQCGASSYCSNDATGAACGTCTPLAAPGAACDSASEPCGVGFYCAGTTGTDGGTSATCVAEAAEGEPCEGAGGAPCGPALFCLQGKCVPPLDAGAPCDPAADACDHYQGLECDTGSKTCVPVQLADAGSPCGVPDDTGVGVVGCVGPAICVSSSSEGLAGTCTGPIPIGGACSVTDRYACAGAMLGSAACVNGVCAAIDATQCR